MMSTKTSAQMHQIIADDYQKNHAGRGYSAEEAQKAFDAYVELGGEYMNFDKVLITYEPREDGVLEFHCINSGNAKELISAVNQFLSAAKSVSTLAATYYDNPKINELAVGINFPTNVSKIDQGEDRTYEMTFDLRK
jgi:hypothetical protein